VSPSELERVERLERGELVKPPDGALSSGHYKLVAGLTYGPHIAVLETRGWLNGT
jgi:hypothetical protein